MADEVREKPFLKGDEGPLSWDWWGENPAEIILVLFIIVLFLFVHSLPPQGWGIDHDPAAGQPLQTAPAVEAVQQ